MKNKILTVLQIIMAVIALFALGKVVVTVWDGYSNRHQQEEKVSSDYLEKYNSEYSTMESTDPFEGPGQEKRDRDYLADLSIPKLDINEKLYLGSDRRVLKYGVGLIPGSPMVTGTLGDNSLIAGHRGYPGISDYFMYIDQLEEGDDVILYTNDKTFYYKVLRLYVKEPDEMAEVKDIEDKSLITLVTCHPVWAMNRRLLVECELVNTEDLPAEE